MNCDEDELDKIFRQNNKDIWKGELSDLVNDYFDNKLLVLDFCSAVDGCLKRAGHLESFINEACRKFEDEHHCIGEKVPVQDYSRTLEELRNFKMVGDPFTAGFFEIFNSIYSHQILLRKRLHNKLGESKSWRKVSNIIFAVANPLLWKKYLWNLTRQRELKGSMQRRAYVVANNLHTIGRMAARYQSAIEGLLLIVDYAIMRGGDVVGIVVEEIKKRQGEFVEINHELSEYVDFCRDSLRITNDVRM